MPLTHRQLLRRVAAPGAWYTPGRRHGCAHAHLFPGYQVLTALAAGGTVVFEPLHAASPLEEFLRDRRIEWLWGSPALFALVARQKQPLADPLPALQAAVSSGAILEPECADAVRRRWGVPVWQGYGQSELGFLPESGPGSAPDSAGRAVPGVILRVADEAGLSLPCGREGRILARLEHPFPGYLGGEPSPVGADGWIATGDLGCLDAAGDLQVSGRDTDQIQVAGNKVFAREVEAVIRACPGIADAAVFSLPHPLWGEVVAAAVVARAEPPPTRRDVLRFCRDRLQAWKCPRQLLFLPELPRSALGKVDLPRLRDLLGAAPS
ncbi:MAG: fatty acid--CoA ligase family protein [Kiritimatiellia bacterium]